MRLTQDVFDVARQHFGTSMGVGRKTSREVFKSWTYIQESWNKFARTPVTSTIESAIKGNDADSVIFRLFTDGNDRKETTTKNVDSKKNVR